MASVNCYSSANESIIWDSPASWKVSNVQFDPEGDVIIVIPSEALERTARFQVNSHSLCLASSVFRAMLGANAHFKEGNALRNRSSSSPPIEITLVEDEPKALALLLRIVHLQYDWVPRTLNHDQLYQIAIVCDKYDMRQALGLWPDQWIPMNTEAGGEVAGDRWLFIAYAFGRQALFTQLSKELILTSTVDAGGGGSLLAPLPISNIACGINCYIPYSILAEITTRRQQAIKGMLGYIHQQIKTYRDPAVLRCAHQTKTNLCDSFFFGFLLKTFAELGYDQVLISIQELKGQVDGLKSPDTIILQTKSSRVCGCSSPSLSSGRCGFCGYPKANHAATCSPIPEWKRQLEGMLSKIQGLEWSQFVRSTKIDGATASYAPPKSTDLWDYLEYN